MRFASNESDDEKGLQSFVSRFVSKDFANQDDLSEPDNDPALEFYSEIDSSDPDDLLAYKYRLKPDVNLDQYSPSQIVDSAPDSQDENPFLDSDDELLEVRSKQPEKPTQRVSSISDRIFQKRKVPSE